VLYWSRAGVGISRCGGVVNSVVGELVGLVISLRESFGVVWFTLVGLTGCTLWMFAGTSVTRRVVSGRHTAATRTVAGLTVAFAFVWIVVNKNLEGPVLLPVSDRHGVTLSDLASVVAVAVVGWRLLRL
jgi:hypothetical protein